MKESDRKKKKKQSFKTKTMKINKKSKNKQTTNMRLSPPHPWKAQGTHSHTSPLMKSPPHQKVQNYY